MHNLPRDQPHRRPAGLRGVDRDKHMALVGHIVRETMARVPAHVDRDDLTSAGLAALVQAAHAYDADRGRAVHPVRRHPHPRRHRRRAAQHRLGLAARSAAAPASSTQTRAQLADALGRAATDAEVAAAAGLSVDEVAANDDDVARAQVLSPARLRGHRRSRRWSAPRPEPRGDRRAARAAHLPGRGRRRAARAAAASSSSSTSSPSGRWPRSPTSSASPSPGSPRSAPRRWSCSRTR